MPRDDSVPGEHVPVVGLSIILEGVLFVALVATMGALLRRIAAERREPATTSLRAATCWRSRWPSSR